MAYSGALYRVAVLFLLAAAVYLLTELQSSQVRDDGAAVLLVVIGLVALAIMFVVTPVVLLTILISGIEEWWRFVRRKE